MRAKMYWTLADYAAGQCSHAQIGTERPTANVTLESSEGLDNDLIGLNEAPVAVARRLAHKALRTVEKLLDDPDPAVALRAAKEVLDRGYGKPAVVVIDKTKDTAGEPWPEWLTSRRLAYQESSHYAEDVKPKERTLLPAPQADRDPDETKH